MLCYTTSYPPQEVPCPDVTSVDVVDTIGSDSNSSSSSGIPMVVWLVIGGALLAIGMKGK